MKILGYMINLSVLWSAIATIVASGALTALVPAHYRAVVAALGAAILALHPSPVGGTSATS